MIYTYEHTNLVASLTDNNFDYALIAGHENTTQMARTFNVRAYSVQLDAAVTAGQATFVIYYHNGTSGTTYGSLVFTTGDQSKTLYLADTLEVSDSTSMILVVRVTTDSSFTPEGTNARADLVCQATEFGSVSGGW